MVSAQETTLQVILEGTKQYQVPLYQRTYSWGKKEQQRLWRDVVELADALQENPGASHFIGSLVLAPTPDVGPAGVNKYLVVDGQQRLTTLTLLLAAIRDHQREALEGAAAEMAFAQINEQYLINKFNQGLDRYKLLPTQGDRAAYQAVIEASPHAGGEDAIGAGYRFFRARLAEADDPDDPHDIPRIQQAVLGALSLVSVTTQPGENVHRIFESLNNTGLKLTQGDLLRNYLFMRLPSQGDVVYNTVWHPLEQNLGAENLEELFWLDLAQTDDRAKASDVYAGQVARLEKLVGEQAIVDEITRLAKLGELLVLILHPEREVDPDVRRRLQRFEAWESRLVRPLLLLLLDRREQGRSTSAEIAQAMLYLESFLVRRLLIGQATKNNNRILSRAVIEVQNADDIAVAVHRYLSTGRKYYATAAEVEAAAKRVPFYLNGRGLQRKLVLTWLEESFGSNEPVDLSQSTIEHVMPQTLNEQWKADLAADLQEGETVEALHAELEHVLGNLTLSGYNGSLGNKGFAEKRAALAESGIRLSSWIAKQNRWGRQQIEERAHELSLRVADIWPGPTDDVEPTGVEAKWHQLRQAVAAVPAGRWTTYSALAALIGSHPQPVGQYLGTNPVTGAFRVLKTRGRLPEGFHWFDDRTETQREALEAEGVTFDATGHADPSRELTTEDLASMLSDEEVAEG